MRTPTDGILEEILAERDRQIAKGHTIEADNQVSVWDLLAHAGHILWPARKRSPFHNTRSPEQDEKARARPMRERLIRCITVLVAAVEREDRLQGSPTPPEPGTKP